MKIGIAGYGFVGQAVHSCMKDDCQPVIHDPPQGLDKFDELQSCEVIFCCLPTPTKGGEQIFIDYSNFLQEMHDYRGLLIIKSTVLYHYIQDYISKPHYYYEIVINPEFLNQNDFKNDFYEQKIIVLGGRVDNCRLAESTYRKNFKFKSKVAFEYCSIKEAIELKYTHNVYHAYKVLYWNFIHERCGNQRKLFSLYSKLTGNTNELAQIYADGTPGYGGACFPKDVKAFNFERTHELTEFMIKYNARLRKDFPEDER